MATEDDKRVQRYAEAIACGYGPEHRAYMAATFTDEARAVIAIADAEMAELRAKIARVEALCERLDQNGGAAYPRVIRNHLAGRPSHYMGSL